MPYPFLEELREILSWPKLRVLNLQDIENFPIDDLYRCVRLETLGLWATTLCNIVLGGSLPSPSAVGRSKMHLHTLHLHSIRISPPLLSAFRDPSSPLSSTRLRKLRTEIWDDQSFLDCQTLLKLVGTRLQELELIVVEGKSGFTYLSLCSLISRIP
jgi:hypothetical protein